MAASSSGGSASAATGAGTRKRKYLIVPPPPPSHPPASVAASAGPIVSPPPVSPAPAAKALEAVSTLAPAPTSKAVAAAHLLDGESGGEEWTIDNRPPKYSVRERAATREIELIQHQRDVLLLERKERALNSAWYEFRRQDEAFQFIAAASPPAYADQLRVFAVEYPVSHAATAPAAAFALEQPVVAADAEPATAAAAMAGPAIARKSSVSVPASLIAADPTAAAEIAAAAGGGGGGTGARKFLVARYSDFYWKYMALPKLSRNHYELIRHNTPCNLYFDIEYKIKPNPSLDGSACVEVLIDRIIRQFQSAYGLTMDRRAIIDLESTTSEKFSRHLIVRLCDDATGRPRVAFANNLHAGAFVRELVAGIERDRATDNQLNQLYALKGDDSTSRALIIDTGVYTRNRCFRLFRSCKAGKTEPLMPTTNVSLAATAVSAAAAPVRRLQRYRYRPASELNYFFASLVCNTDTVPPPTAAVPTPAAATAPLTQSSTGAAAASPARSKAPAGVADAALAVSDSPLRYLTCTEGVGVAVTAASTGAVAPPAIVFHHSVTDDLAGALAMSTTANAVTRSHSGAAATSVPTASCTASVRVVSASAATSSVSASGAASWYQVTRRDHPSPFPRLEALVLSLANDGGVVPFIPSYRYLMDGSGSGRVSTICYNIGGNKWCGRLGRAHKSNGKYAVCQILPADGTDAKSKSGFVPSFHFRCHDHECRNWRSNEFPIDETFVVQKLAPPPPPATTAAAAASAVASGGADESAFEAALLALPL